MALLTPRVAASRLGIGYSTLKRWIHSGQVRTTKTTGGHHRVDEAEVDRLVSSSDTPGESPVTAHTPSGPIVTLSARNRLRGYVEEVRTDGLLGQVRLRIGGQRLTAVITRDAIEDLDLRRGDDAIAIVKSTEVMIAREVPPDRQAASRPGNRRRRKGQRTASRRPGSRRPGSN
jgi:molybdopterin-binding protein